jgi:hypothetical protein
MTNLQYIGGIMIPDLWKYPLPSPKYEWVILGLVFVCLFILAGCTPTSGKLVQDSRIFSR